MESAVITDYVGLLSFQISIFLCAKGKHVKRIQENVSFFFNISSLLFLNMCCTSSLTIYYITTATMQMT